MLSEKVAYMLTRFKR